jgi:hypothetical protein
MMAARVQALIGVAGETITYKQVTHGCAPQKFHPHGSGHRVSLQRQ